MNIIARVARKNLNSQFIHVMVQGGIGMMGMIVILVIAVILAGIISSALGIDNDGEFYDWRTESMVYVPTRADIILDLIIKS